jgi:hypothetical protein
MDSDQQANVRRLKALMSMFPGVTIADVATVGKVSRPLVSGLLAGRPEVRAHGLFQELERCIPALVGIAVRRRTFFALEGVPVEQVEEAGRSVPSRPDAPIAPLTISAA